jgi:hypothetical protein
MAEYKKDIELRSEKVRNIVGQVPPVLLRQGIAIISLVLLLLFAGAYFIPYPETIRINIQLQNATDNEIKAVGYCSPLMKSKLKEGQIVRLELFGYPSNIYGLIEGQIVTIYSIPEISASKEPLFKTEISFPSQLRTSYGETIPYAPQMEGTGSILLSDASLLERFFTWKALNRSG